jgi:hypothetical protein
MTDLLPDLEAQLERYGDVLRDELARPAPPVPTERRSGTRSRLVLAAAAVVFVVLVAAGIVVSRSNGPAGRTPTTNATSTSTTVVPGQDPHRLAAEARAADLLGRVRPGPGWTSVRAAPVAMLSKPFSTPATPELVQRTAFWIAPGPWASVDSYVEAHPPAGLASSGRGSVGVHGATTLRGFVFGSGGPSGLVRQESLTFSTAPLADGRVGVRADAQVVWVPTRPADEVVPTAENAVTVTATWGFGSAAHRESRSTHDRATIDALSSLLNGLDVADTGAHGCVLDVNLRVTLRFTGSTPSDTVVAEGNPSCFQTGFMRAGVDGRALATTPAYFDQAARVLGTTMTRLQEEALAAATVPPPSTTPTTR